MEMFNFAQFFVLFLCLSGMSCAPQYVGTRFDKKYYINSDVLDFRGAQSSCEVVGGRLVKISNQMEQDYVHAVLESRESYWIGATNKAGTLHFSWLDGSPMSFERWYSNQPNEPEDCSAVFYHESDKRWYDAACTYRLRSLCEIEMTVAPSGQGSSGSGHSKGMSYEPVSTKIVEDLIANMTTGNSSGIEHFFRWASTTISLTNKGVDRNADKLVKLQRGFEEGTLEMVRKSEDIVQMNLNVSRGLVEKVNEHQEDIVSELKLIKVSNERANSSYSELEARVTNMMNLHDASITKLAVVLSDVNSTNVLNKIELQNFITDRMKSSEEKIRANTKEIVSAMERSLKEMLRSLNETILIASKDYLSSLNFARREFYSEIGKINSSISALERNFSAARTARNG